MRACCFIIQTSFTLQREYSAAATSRLQSWLTTCAHPHSVVDVVACHAITQNMYVHNMDLRHFNYSITYNYTLDK